MSDAIVLQGLRKSFGDFVAVPEQKPGAERQAEERDAHRIARVPERQADSEGDQEQGEKDGANHQEA